MKCHFLDTLYIKFLQYSNYIVYRLIAHYFALNTAMNMIPQTTQKYYKQFSQLPIENSCLYYTYNLFPNLISKIYLNKIKFNKSIITDIQSMVQLIKSSFGQLLDANTWMDPVTKKIAKEKLLAIQANVGAPDIVFDEKLFDEYNAEVR